MIRSNLIGKSVSEDNQNIGEHQIVDHDVIKGGGRLNNT